MKKWWFSSSYLLGIFLVWIVASMLVNQPLILPSPFAVLDQMIRIFTSTESLSAIAMTLFRLITAVGISFLFGLLMGVLAYTKPYVKAIITPIVAIFRTVPVVSIILLVLIVLGMRIAPFVITFLMIFPISYQATIEGLVHLDHDFVDVYVLEDNHWFQKIRFCYFPLIAGYLKTAILQSGGLGIKVLVMAEYLAQTPNSIGASLYLEKIYLQYDAVFGWTLILILMALLFEFAIKRSKQWLSTTTDTKRS